MNIKSTIVLDMAVKGPPARVVAAERDSGTREVEILLFNFGQAWTVPEGVAASLVYKKSDGTSGWYDVLPDGSDACSIRENIVTVKLAPQVMSVPCVVSAALMLQQEGKQLTTFDFCIDVKNSPANTETSKDYYNLKVVASVEDLEARVEVLEKGGTGAGSITVTPEGDALVITTSMPVTTDGDAIIIGGA